MTCVVAVKQDGWIYMGADSAGVAGWDITIRRGPKVFRNRAFLIGCTGSFRFTQLLRYQFVPPEHPHGFSAHRYLATAYVDSLRSLLKKAGYAKVKDNVENIEGFHIVAYRGGLYKVESDFQVGMSALLYTALGCGRDYALGSLYTTSRQSESQTGEWRVRSALRAAAKFSAAVAPPFVVRRIRA